MAEIEIPSYFLCPISYQIMKDPVTLSTGITYDRSSIERWIYTHKQQKCPVTNQDLLDSILIPNHTLRRLIQAWCVVNASNEIERFPTPRPPIDQAYIANLIEKARSKDSELSSLQNLKSLVLESYGNRHCVESNSSAIDFLSSFITADLPSGGCSDEALSILSYLQIPDNSLIDLVSRKDSFINSLTNILLASNNVSRANAMSLLKSIIKVIAPARLVAIEEKLFIEMRKMLRDKISTQATKSALETLAMLCPWGKNRIKAVRSSVVHVLIELLIEDQSDKRICEMLLVILDKLSGCAEGRAEIVAHAAGIAVISKKILRVSTLGTDRAVRILYSIARYSGTEIVLKEMIQVGVVSKLCMMLLVDCGPKMKERARELLRMHSRVWRNSPCLPPQVQVMYP